MATVDEMILNGMDEDVIADQILREQSAKEAAKKKAAEAPVIDIPSPAAPQPKPPAPKVEVVQPNRKLLVVFPAENRADIRVAAYEDVVGGGRKVLEQWRKPTDYERRSLASAHKELLAGSDGEIESTDETVKKVWKYGKWVLGGVAVLGAGYMAANHFGLIGGDDD